ncbi:hypothetical protein L596_002288 [Steinernema carpocapsae]|uniref:Uncharacterized protein n=1 Tax=Steinernema carpocapsae TaxID=34508 RepID=A0A4U8UP28_STECR|nr:hypothetical protein L596_002288 [Steinernema carpocapsae]
MDVTSVVALAVIADSIKIPLEQVVREGEIDFMERKAIALKDTNRLFPSQFIVSGDEGEDQLVENFTRGDSRRIETVYERLDPA